MPRYTALLLPLCLLALGCRPKTPPPATQAEVQTLVRDSNRMGLELYRALAKQGDNQVFSPLGLCGPMALLAWGADETTAREIQSALHLTLPPVRIPVGLEAIRQRMLKPVSSLFGGTPEKPRLDFGLAIWSDSANPIPWSSRRKLPVLFSATAENLDFQGDPSGSRDHIQQWATARMDGMKVDGDPGPLPPNGLAIFGSVRFGARWGMPFQPEMTRTEPFRLLDGREVPVPMMHHHEHWPYFKDRDCEATVLDYHGTCLEMVILLPEPGRFQAVEESLSLERLERISAGFQAGSWNSVQAEVFLPRFTITSKLKLNDALAERGLAPLISGASSLPRLQARTAHHPLSIQQSTRFEVDEKGTQAATLTSISTDGMATTKPFRANRPFLFLIRDRDTGAILYLGRYVDPTAASAR